MGPCCTSHGCCMAAGVVVDQKQRCLVQVSKGEALGVSYSSDPHHGPVLLLLSWPLCHFTLDPSSLLRLQTVGQRLPTHCLQQRPACSISDVNTCCSIWVEIQSNSCNPVSAWTCCEHKHDFSIQGNNLIAECYLECSFFKAYNFCISLVFR